MKRPWLIVAVVAIHRHYRSNDYENSRRDFSMATPGRIVKPSGIAAKEMILRVHLVAAMGHKKLNAIKSEDVQHLKSRLSTKAAKTNILTVLNVLMKKAVQCRPSVLQRFGDILETGRVSEGKING